MKNRVALIISLVCGVVLFTACSRTVVPTDDVESDAVNTAYRKITAGDAKELLDDGAAFILVDVRRADEYETAHIPSAINIPNESIDSTQPDALPDLNQTVVVYCRSGVRSKQAADKLIEMGFTDVRDMGGITTWPYDTVSGTEPGEYS